MRIAIVLGCCAAFGCSAGPEIRPEPEPEPAPEPGWVSGERLVVRVIRSADGAEQPVGFRDSQLEVDCSFARTVAGWRCVPDGPEAVYYEDASCQFPVLHVGACTDGVEYARTTSRACGGGVEVWRIGQEIDAQQVWSRIGSDCVSVPRPAGQVLRMTPTDPASFAAGAESER